MPAWAAGLHRGQEAENQPSPPPVSLSRPLLPLHLPPPSFSSSFSWVLSLLVPAPRAAALAAALLSSKASLHLCSTSSTPRSSGKAHGGFAEISCINITLTVSASKLMAVTGEKAKSSWKCRMALTQPQMLWLAGIEVGKSLIRGEWWRKAKIF